MSFFKIASNMATEWKTMSNNLLNNWSFLINNTKVLKVAAKCEEIQIFNCFFLFRAKM